MLWAGSSGALESTSDGGATWTAIESPCGGNVEQQAVATDRLAVWDVCFDYPALATAQATRTLFVTHDFGHTWSTRAMPAVGAMQARNGYINVAAASGDGAFITASNQSAMTLTRNRGERRSHVGPDGLGFRSIRFAIPPFGVAIDVTGGIWVSTDEGAAWTQWYIGLPARPERSGKITLGLKAKAPVAAELSWDEVHAYRVARHHLASRAPKHSMLEAVGDIGGAQAQVMSSAELQIATRVDCRVSDVRHALWTDRTLVKTWLMRGTLHLVPARDLPLFTAALSTRVSLVPRASWLKYFDITEPELAQMIETIGGSLDGEPMTREQIIADASKGQNERVRTYLKSGWGGFLKPVARRGLLCFGPSRGQTVTFVNPRAWLGSWQELDPDVALVELARRYLHAFGPATRQDFTFWLGHWRSVGAAAWDGLKEELVDVSVEGRRAQMLAADLERIPSTTRGNVRLLAPFDPYLMGWASRAHLFDSVHRAKVTRTAGWISAVVLVDGRVEGTWTHLVAKDVLRIKIAPFDRLLRKTAAQVERRAAELAAALGAARAEVAFS